MALFLAVRPMPIMSPMKKLPVMEIIAISREPDSSQSHEELGTVSIRESPDEQCRQVGPDNFVIEIHEGGAEHVE